jgi:hypothetical protein
MPFGAYTAGIGRGIGCDDIRERNGDGSLRHPLGARIERS